MYSARQQLPVATRDDLSVNARMVLTAALLLSLLAIQSSALLPDAGLFGGAGQEGTADEYHSFHECKYDEVNVHVSCEAVDLVSLLLPRLLRWRSSIRTSGASLTLASQEEGLAQFPAVPTSPSGSIPTYYLSTWIPQSPQK